MSHPANDQLISNHEDCKPEKDYCVNGIQKLDDCPNYKEYCKDHFCCVCNHEVTGMSEDKGVFKLDDGSKYHKSCE